MRLGDFILANIEPILVEWESFARGIWPGPGTDPVEMRDHAEAILRATVDDMAAPQSHGEQSEKSMGRGDDGENSAEMVHVSAQHADARVVSGFDLTDVVAEYRALRASVLRLWRKSNPSASSEDLAELTRFNESIDQSLTIALTAYSDRVSQARKMFLAILAHDLRDPLQAIRLIGDVLAHSGQLDAEHAEMAAQIPDVAASMTRLIGDLLTFTEAELPGGMPIAPAPADLAAIGRQLVDQFQAAHPDVPIAFRVHGDLLGEWDAARLQQALSNLLGNAFQHGAHAANGGAATDAVELAIVGRADAVTVTVHNGGSPIPPKLLPVIFDPMVRGTTPSHRPGSMGLGLAIARSVVLAHDGTIDVTSTAEAGTTFTVRLPRKSGK